MESGDKDVWVCRASGLEELYDITHKNGTFLMAYQLSLSTVLPLQEADVRQALLHLRRNCPIFHICFGKRNGETWFRKTEHEDIDFQVVNDMSPGEVLDTLQTYRYNSEKGPLWCARLLVDSKPDKHALDEGFPHTSHLIIGIVHSIADGTSMLIIFGAFVKVLEDILAGKTKHDNKPIGRFISDTKNESMVSSKIETIQKDPVLLEKLAAYEKDKGVGKPLLLSAFPPPEGGEDKTNGLTHVLDRDTTKQFFERCKSEGVTVHSAFCAISNVTTIKLMGEKGHTKESYRLCSAHMVNLRRYWPGDTSDVLGCHAHFPLSLFTDVPRDVLEKGFWDYARTLHKDVHHHLKEETSLLMEAYVKHSFPDPSYDDIFHTSNPMQNDGAFSNLGNTTAYLTEGGVHVRPYLLTRRISLHRTFICNLGFFFHTFRSRLILNLLFNLKSYSTDTAEKYIHMFSNILQQIIN